MKRTLASGLAAMLFMALPAHAHKDRIIPIGPQGELYELPAEFGVGRLHVSFHTNAGKPAISGVMLALGQNQTELPGCLARLLKTSAASDITASASWYHNETQLPYYLQLDFPNPGVIPGTPYHSGYLLLFNLRTASLMRMSRAAAGARGKTVKYVDIDLSKPCARDNERVVGGRHRAAAGAP